MKLIAKQKPNNLNNLKIDRIKGKITSIIVTINSDK